MNQKGKLFFLLTLTILSLSFVNADLYSTPSIYGNPAIKTVITFNNQTASVNNSNYLQGYTPSTLPLSSAFTSNTTSTFVPYVSANANVNLGTWNLSTQNLIVNQSILGVGNYTADVRGASAFGFINALLPNDTASITATNIASFAHGGINLANQNVTAAITSSGTGSFANGYISTANAASNNNKATILSQGIGSFVSCNVAVSSIGAAKNNTVFCGTNNPAATGAFVAGRTFVSSVSNENASLEADAAGGFAQGYVQDGTMQSTNQGSFVQGYVQGVNAIITSSNGGSFAQGYALCSSLNCFITASGAGSFAHGQIGDAEYIIASGAGSTALGYRNITASNTGSMAFGQSLNMTGAGSIGFGLNGGTNKNTLANTFIVNGGDFYINGSTTPNMYFGQTQYASIKADGTDFVLTPNLVGSGRIQLKGNFNISNFLFGNATQIGIGTSTPTHELNVVGTTNSTHFIGEGAQITNISAGDVVGSITSLSQDFTDKANSGTSETVLYNTSITANQLTAVGDSLYCSFAGSIGSVASSTEQIKLYYSNGTIQTSIFDTGALSVATAGDYTVVSKIIRINSTRLEAQSYISSGLSSSAKTVKIDSENFGITNYLNFTGTAAGIGGASNQIFYNNSLCDYRRGA